MVVKMNSDYFVNSRSAWWQWNVLSMTLKRKPARQFTWWSNFSGLNGRETYFLIFIAFIVSYLICHELLSLEFNYSKYYCNFSDFGSSKPYIAIHRVNIVSPCNCLCLRNVGRNLCLRNVGRNLKKSKRYIWSI